MHALLWLICLLKYGPSRCHSRLIRHLLLSQMLDAAPVESARIIHVATFSIVKCSPAPVS